MSLSKKIRDGKGRDGGTWEGMAGWTILRIIQGLRGVLDRVSASL